MTTNARRTTTSRSFGRLLAAVLAVLCAASIVAVPAPAGAQAPPPDSTPASTAPADAGGEATLTWSVKPGNAGPGGATDRPNYSYDLEPGSRITDSIIVRNFRAEPLPLTIYASDGVTTASGALDLLPAGEPSVDVGSWIVLEAVNIEVPANGTLEVPFTLTVPPDAEAGDHTGGIVTSFRSPGTDEDGQAVVVDRRLGSRLHVRVGGELRPALEITDVSVDYAGTANPFGTGDATVTYTVTNTGNVRLGAEQAIVIPGRLGFPGRQAELAPMGELLPGNSLTFTADIPDVWATVRTGATVELTPVPTRSGDVFPDTTPTATASASAWSVPWTLLAAVVVVIAAPSWVRWSRARRARGDAQRMQQMVETAVMVQAAVNSALGSQTAPANGDAPAPAPPTPPPGPPGGLPAPEVDALRSTSQHDM